MPVLKLVATCCGCGKSVDLATGVPEDGRVQDLLLTVYHAQLARSPRAPACVGKDFALDYLTDPSGVIDPEWMEFADEIERSLTDDMRVYYRRARQRRIAKLN